MSITVEVRNNNVEQAMRVLKRKLQKAGTLKEYRDKQYYKKPSEKRVERMKERAKVLAKAQKKKDEYMCDVFIKGKKKRRI
jgi:small subunit ribosomal protein S21